LGTHEVNYNEGQNTTKCISCVIAVVLFRAPTQDWELIVVHSVYILHYINSLLYVTSEVQSPNHFITFKYDALTPGTVQTYTNLL